eukprot:13993973-Heterocapsa_arctica.AAC.1
MTIVIASRTGFDNHICLLRCLSADMLSEDQGFFKRNCEKGRPSSWATGRTPLPTAPGFVLGRRDV